MHHNKLPRAGNFLARLFPFLFAIFQLVSCPHQLQAQSPLEKNSIFFDQSLSTFEILSGDTTSGFDYKTVEINYNSVFLTLNDGYNGLKYYLAKYTTTTQSCTGCEGQERNIKVEIKPFDHPEQTVLTIDRDCDKIDLDAHTYKTIIYGCCGDEDELEIFDYQQQSIIQADRQIVLGSIPNSAVRLYIGYKKEAPDAPYSGYFTLAYNSSEKYIIRIKSDESPDENCTAFSPQITIKTANPKDTFQASGNEYTLWSLNKIESNTQINGLVIQLNFDCEETPGTIDIPLINGKPFGKNLKKQEISFERK